jgi:hypothetical protein
LRRTCFRKVEQVKLLLKFGRKPWQNPATEATLTFQTLPQLLMGIGPFQTFKTFSLRSVQAVE